MKTEVETLIQDLPDMDFAKWGWPPMISSPPYTEARIGLQHFDNSYHVF